MLVHMMVPAEFLVTNLPEMMKSGNYDFVSKFGGERDFVWIYRRENNVLQAPVENTIRDNNTVCC